MAKRLKPTMRTLFLAGAAMLGAGSEALADQVHYTYTVAAGASTGPVTIPISNYPVIVSCVQTVGSNVSTGQATLVRSTTDNELVWNGYDASGLVTNQYQAINTHIIYCDYFKKVDIQAASSTQIKIVNGYTATQTVVIMFTY